MPELTTVCVQARDEEVRPLLFLPAVICGSTLTLRSREATIEVRAPARFLRALMDECDGSRTVADLLAEMEVRWGPSQFGNFVQAMLDQGVLIDASFRYLYVWTDLPKNEPRARMGMPVQRQAAAGARHFSSPSLDATLVSSSQAIGLLNALSARRIGVGLAGHPPERQAIEGCLLFAGANPVAHEILIVARSDQATGLRVQSGSQGKWADVFRAIGNPYEMRGAVAVAVLVADYEDDALTWASADRARQAILLAGAALQRAALYAATQAWEFHSVESFDSARLGSLCQMSAQAVLACAIFRVAYEPPAESSEAKTPLAVQLQWVSSEEHDDQSQIVRATMTRPFDRGAVGWGRARNPRDACAIAISEIAERHSYREITKPIVLHRGIDLRNHVEPQSLVLFSDSQYRDPTRGVVPYRNDVLRHWTEGVDVNAGTSVWLPADCVFHAGCLPEDARAQLLMKPTSSGCASDTCPETALQRAAHELIERDALIRHWLAQRSGKRMSMTSLPGTFSRGIAHLKAMGLEFDIGVLEASLGPVIVVGLTSDKHSFCSIGAGSGDCLTSVLEHALSEAEAAAMIRVRHRLQSPMRVRSVMTPDDHGNLFAQRRYFQRAHALLRGQAASEEFSSIEKQWPSSLEERLKRPQGPSSLYSVDLTAPNAPVSLDGLRIRTVRALIPGTVPIAFGYDAIPLGMGARVIRAGRFPHPLP